MISRETHRFIIRENETELDAFWIKRFLVKPTDLDCTEMSIEEFGELYQAKLDARKTTRRSRARRPSNP